MKKNIYRIKQAELREEAIDWQQSFNDYSYSYGELAEWCEYFENKGRQLGLIKEFKENGIL